MIKTNVNPRHWNLDQPDCPTVSGHKTFTTGLKNNSVVFKVLTHLELVMHIKFVRFFVLSFSNLFTAGEFPYYLEGQFYNFIVHL